MVKDDDESEEDDEKLENKSRLKGDVTRRSTQFTTSARRGGWPRPVNYDYERMWDNLISECLTNLCPSSHLQVEAPSRHGDPQHSGPVPHTAETCPSSPRTLYIRRLRVDCTAASPKGTRRGRAEGAGQDSIGGEAQ
jgi:hypothetical protein